MNEEGTSNDWLVTLALYVAWLVASIGAIINALYIRQALLAVLQALQVIQQDAYQKSGGLGLNLQVGYAIETFNNFLLLAMGCAAIGFVVWVEYYFRKGRPKGLLWKRMGKVFAVEVGIFIVCIIILTVV